MINIGIIQINIWYFQTKIFVKKKITYLSLYMMFFQRLRQKIFRINHITQCSHRNLTLLLLQWRIQDAMGPGFSQLCIYSWDNRLRIHPTLSILNFTILFDSHSRIFSTVKKESFSFKWVRWMWALRPDYQQCPRSKNNTYLLDIPGRPATLSVSAPVLPYDFKCVKTSGKPLNS